MKNSTLLKIEKDSLINLIEKTPKESSN